MKPMVRWSCVVLVLLVGGAAMAQEEPSSLPVLSDRPDEAALLGPVFTSESAGLAFRPPAGGKLIRRQVADEIVQYVNDDKHWSLLVSRARFEEAIGLREYRDAAGQLRPGLLQLTIDQFKRQQPGAEVLRQNYVRIGDVDAGLLALRYAVGTSGKLTQQAIFKANDRVYYILNFITPGARQARAGVDDPLEKEAAEVFRHVVDSVRILDRAAIKRDQDQRLYRTRTLFVNLSPEKIRQAMIPQQWLRLMRDGKDIGYTYVVEEADKNRQDGILIGMRSRTMPEAGVRVDAESWLGTTLDRRHESWTTAVLVDEQGKRDYTTEFGVSNIETERVLDDTLRRGTAEDPNQPPVRKRDVYTLEVSYVGKSSVHPPVKRDLPVFYIPQAIGQMLPRLLPLNDPKGYMFAVWVSDQHQVMARYVDVLPLTDVTFGGKKQTVVPIRDRIGLEGSPTIHYMTLDGRYLGSENKESGIVVLPSDEPALRKIWADADLTRPAPMPRK